MFAWSLGGAVALAVYSGRPTLSEAATPLTLVPLEESKGSQAPEAESLQPGSRGSKSDSLAQPKPRTRVALKSIRWETSFEGAMKKAKAQGKPVMIDFYTDWCHWCKELDKHVYNDKVVVTESANWVSVKVNADKRPDVAKSYGVTGYPTIAFVLPTGKPITVLPGYAEAPEFAKTMQDAYANRFGESARA